MIGPKKCWLAHFWAMVHGCLRKGGKTIISIGDPPTEAKLDVNSEDEHLLT